MQTTRRVALLTAAALAGVALLTFTLGNPTPQPVQANDAPAYANPDAPETNQTAPETFDTRFTVQRGDDASTQQTFTVRTTRAWAPRGADRFYSLVATGFFNNQRVFRVVPNFVAQFGIHGDPRVAAAWRDATIQDDPLRSDVNNTTGRVVFANRGANTRTTQLFINLDNNANLDIPQGRARSLFPPFGEVVEGLDVALNINDQYGQQPDQQRIQTQGNAYLDAEFPNLTRIISAQIVEPETE